MKKCFKNIFIMFFMLVGITGFYSINVFAEDTILEGVKNLNGTAENSAKVGQKLLYPEKGWSRYDDKNSKIYFNGGRVNSDNTGAYKGSYAATTTDKDNIICIKAYTSNFRLISSGGKGWRSNNIVIEIDGEKVRFNENDRASDFQNLVFEKLDMEKKVHDIKIYADEQTTVPTQHHDYRVVELDAIDIDTDGYLIDASKSLSLKEKSLNLKTGESNKLNVVSDPADAKLTWSSSDESIASVDQTGKVTAVKEGKAIITVKMDGIDLKSSCEVVVSKPAVIDSKILNIEPEKEKIELKQNVTADVVIDNIKEIAAEDMIIKYDSEKLKFLGAEAVDGIKVVKDDESEGQLRVILASQGKDNIANAKKVLLKLNFQGIAVGDALVDITTGKISDGIEMERDLADAECGQATITIEDYKDPNKDGEFTLLDLAIDGRYYGLNPADYPQYRTDVVENGAIDDDDLLKIGKYMMENPNYSFN